MSINLNELTELALETEKLELAKKALEVELNEMRAKVLEGLKDLDMKNIKLSEGSFSITTRKNESLTAEGLDLVKKKPFSSGYWKNTVDLDTCRKDAKISACIVENPVDSVRYTPKK